MSAESNIKVGDRVRFRFPGHPEDGKSCRVNRDFRPDQDELEVVVDGTWTALRSRPCFLGCLPDPAQAVPESPFKPGERIRINRTSDNRQYHGMEGRVVCPVDDEKTRVKLDGLVLDQVMWNEILQPIQAESDLMARLEEGVEPPKPRPWSPGTRLRVVKGSYKGCVARLDSYSIEGDRLWMTLPDGQIMSAPESYVEPDSGDFAVLEPQTSKSARPDPTIEGTVAGAAAWAQQDPDLRRVTVAVHKGVVDIHANLSPFSAARRLRLCIPFCADAVSCFLDGMMMEPDRGLCVTVNRSAEVA